jgi:hypothetical protein
MFLMIERRRRVAVVVLAMLSLLAGLFYESWQQNTQPVFDILPSANVATDVTAENTAVKALGELAIKGRAPKTGYKRAQFGEGWQQVGPCDVRNHILNRDLNDVKTVSETECTVLSGTLADPYTGKTIFFVRGSQTSDDVQIDHVVALSDAWQKGAQQLSAQRRIEFSNDPLNLLAVDGPANQQKGDGDAATWLPSNKSYRCRYVARQIAVKSKYTLWVTRAEHDAMRRILDTCPGQLLPRVI